MSLEAIVARVKQVFEDNNRKRRVETSIQGPSPKYIKIFHETDAPNCYHDGPVRKQTLIRKSAMGSILSKFKSHSKLSSQTIEHDEYSDSEDIIFLTKKKKNSLPSPPIPINIIQHHKMDRSKDNSSMSTTRPVPSLISRNKFSQVPDLQKCYTPSHNITFTRTQHINGYRSENESNMIKGLMNGNSVSSFKSQNSRHQGNNLCLSREVSDFFNTRNDVSTSYSHVPSQNDFAEKLLKSILPEAEHDFGDTHSLWGSSNIHSMNRNAVPHPRPPIRPTSFINLVDDEIKRKTEDTRRLLSESSIDNEHKSVPVNSIRQKFETKYVFHNSFLENLNERYTSESKRREELISQQKSRSQAISDSLLINKISFENRLPEWQTPVIVIFDEDVEEKIDDFPEFTDQQKAIIRQAIVGHTQTVLISKFNTSITRDHIRTLQWDPLTWLNDEVMNFYMNLLTERGELRSNEGYPKVYAMNTFFTQRLCSGGYSAVRRWTKKVDIFACDLIPVPVHVGNVHWCMAIINMKEKTIKYYDSMGSPNHRILSALEQYLKEESLDKRKVEFDFSGWSTENVTDNPRQQNGSDCGVFSCMTAEFICRNRPIVFNQQHMNYFRQKMIIEICTGKLIM